MHGTEAVSDLRHALCDDPNVLVPEILAEWQGIAQEEPWLELPEQHRFNSLPDVTYGLLDVALCRTDDPAAIREKLDAAASHGWTRREQGFPQELVLTEYYLLREAIWRVLRRRWPDEAAEAVFRVDTVLSVATRASLAGYHRAELEALGRWPAALERLVASSPLAQRDQVT